MPKVRLYNRDVRFHTANGCNPFTRSAAAYRNHVAWQRLTPQVWFEVQRFPSDFTTFADNFSAAGLTGCFNETGSGTWSFVAGATAQNIGRAVAYIADMYRAYYAARGISHDGRYAWWPANAGQAGNIYGAFNAYSRQWALWPFVNGSNVYANGSTSDYLQISSWTGSTASQLAVAASTPYIVAGATAFAQWVQLVASGISAGLAGRSNVSAPAIVAGDFEQTPAFSGQIFLENNNQEVGVWQQALNDPRANTYRFFDRHTFVELWGATGGSAQYGRSPHQWSIPFTVTACNNSSNALSVPSRPVDIIWGQRFNYINYTPSWFNFYSSMMTRHREHLWNVGWQPMRNAFPGTLVGNYQNHPSTKRYPDRSVAKISGYNYTCDLGCTGPAGATVGYNNPSVTGTFSLDYAAPVCYIKVGGFDYADNDGFSNFLPGYGALGSIRSHYEGTWGVVANERLIGGNQIFGEGTVAATYVNFLQACSKEGITGISGGGTAEGYTGGNILDLRKLWLQYAKNIASSSRWSLDSFNDNINKPVIPWIGTNDFIYSSIFSLTASSSLNKIKYADVNGITSWHATAYNPLFLDFNVAFIKYCINTLNINEFFVFEAGGFVDDATGIQALDFWNNVIETLVLDSGPDGNIAPVARINVSPSTTVRDTDGSGSETLLASGLSSSDANGDALSYAWTTSNGLSASGATANFAFPIGTHTIYLTVADITGATGATSVAVTVLANTQPYVQIDVSPATSVRDNDNNGIENFVFSGANSSDPYGGSIVQYAWTIDGATGATGVTAAAGLTVGSHSVMLMVRDNAGATASTSVTVNVLEYVERQRITSECASMLYFGGKIYTREEFDYILKTLYGMRRK